MEYAHDRRECCWASCHGTLMKLSDYELQLLTQYGFSLMNNSGEPLLYDDQTEEAYHKATAISMAASRKGVAVGGRESGQILVGVRTGCMAESVAKNFFAIHEWVWSEMDPRKGDFPLHVYCVTPDDYEAFVEIYMEISGRNKTDERTSPTASSDTDGTGTGPTQPP